MESTGTYHELFANAAHKLGFIVFVLNPKDARHYAKAVGLRGKTDRVDAELLARMIAHEHTKLHAWMPPTPEQSEIARLIKHRAKLSSLRQALGMSLKGLDGFAADLKALSARFDQVIARIDQRVKALVEASPDRKQHVTHLRTIYGVGPVVSAALVNTLERAPLKSADAFVAFTGLGIPGRMTRDSIVASGASPNAAQLNCVGCYTWPRCRPRRPKHGSRSSSITEQRDYPVLRLSSSWLGASPAPPGRCTPTKQNSILRASQNA